MPTTQTQMNAVSAVRAAIEAVGGVSNCAALLGLAAPTVHEWKSGKKDVPLIRAIQLERICYGAVRAEEIRPEAADEIMFLRGAKRRQRRPVAA